MKKIVSILLIGLVLNACKNEEKKQNESYVINGTAEGIYNGIRVYLKEADERGTPIPKDTAIVMDGKFTFDGKVDQPKLWLLSVANVNGVVPVMVENEDISITINKANFQDTKVTGTKANEALSEYNQGYRELMDKRIELNDEFAAARNTADSLNKAKITQQFTDYNEELKAYPLQFVKSHNDTYMSLSLLENLIKQKPDDVTEIEAAFNNLTDDIKNSVYGKMVQTKLNDLKKYNEGLTMLNIGKIAPNFTAPDPDGKQVSLNDIKGKATIIDFWASWCGPCRKENPNVVNVYNKYHDKGLEIISVSLDRPGQKDRWLKAIEDDKLTWHHVSNLSYFNDPVARQYNIQSIPATFILDADGKIVAKTLRGQALEDKIAEMLN